MRLTIVGCAPAYTSRSGSASSCYLVEHGESVVVLDFGQGSFSELWRYRSPDTVTAVFISHMHADHNVDLVPLRHWVTYENGGRAPALYGPPELRARFDGFQHPEFLAAFKGDDLDEGVVRVGELSVEARRVTHIPNSFAFRVSAIGEDAPGLVYSGDCGVADDLLPLVRAGDTLLSEAAFGLGPADAPIHLTIDEAARVAKYAGTARLVLTHVLDRHATEDLVTAAKRQFDGEVLLAEPGLSLDIR